MLCRYWFSSTVTIMHKLIVLITNVMQSLAKFKAVEVATFVLVMTLKCILHTKHHASELSLAYLKSTSVLVWTTPRVNCMIATCILWLFNHELHHSQSYRYRKTWPDSIWILASYLKRLTIWIIGALDTSWISTGPKWSPMTRSVLVLGSHSCQTLSVDIVSLSTVTSTALTLGRIITAPSKLASWVLLWSGDGGPADPDRPGWERWRPTCDQWKLAWHQPNDVHRTERHGDNSLSDNGYVHDKPLKKLRCEGKAEDGGSGSFSSHSNCFN